MGDAVALIPVRSVPHVEPGDTVAELLVHALGRHGATIRTGDILVVASKLMAKAEGRVVRLVEVDASPVADQLAARTGQDPRLVELVLRESTDVSAAVPGLLVVRHRLGFVCANAGIDRTNVGGDDQVVLLPAHPDASAAKLREAVLAHTGADVGVVISDTHGRPFRRGNLDVAIGVAGVAAVADNQRTDLFGRTVRTVVPVADQLAAAAGMVMGDPDTGVPASLVRGFRAAASPGRGCDLVRSTKSDLYANPRSPSTSPSGDLT